MNKILTLCLVVRNDEILLGMKKRGFGAGRWNGFGGKIEEGESITDAAKREMKEEADIDVLAMQKAGIVEFSFENDPKMLEVHIFKVTEFSGEPTESEEMRPQWFNLDNIPYEQMWADDKFWLPLLLKGKLFKGTFLFDKPSDAGYSAKIITQDLREVESL